MKIKLSTLTDIIFCIILMPGMMFLFPLGEWMQWHPWYILAFSLWLFGVYFLCRRVLGRLLWNGRKWIWMVAGVVFLLAVLNFAFTLTPVDFPREGVKASSLELHERAMWLLFIVTVAFSLASGAFLSRIEVLESGRQEEFAQTQTLTTMERLGSRALGNESITLKSGYRTVNVPLSHIQYIESRNNYACLHIDHSDDVISQVTLKELLDRLPAGKFVRIHRSFVVPRWRVSSHSATEVVLIGVAAPLPLGRSYKKIFLGN